MNRFPCEMGHVPTEQIELMHSYLEIRRHAGRMRRNPKRAHAEQATQAEDQLSARIAAAEQRRR